MSDKICLQELEISDKRMIALPQATPPNPNAGWGLF